MRRSVSFKKFGFSRSLPLRPSCVRSVVNVESEVPRLASFEITAAKATFEKMNEQSMAKARILPIMYFAVFCNLIGLAPDRSRCGSKRNWGHTRPHLPKQGLCQKANRGR